MEWKSPASSTSTSLQLVKNCTLCQFSRSVRLYLENKIRTGTISPFSCSRTIKEQCNETTEIQHKKCVEFCLRIYGICWFVCDVFVALVFCGLFNRGREKGRLLIMSCFCLNVQRVQLMYSGLVRSLLPMCASVYVTVLRMLLVCFGLHAYW